jgi:DNA-binding CsgD family transcriptional regulator
MGTLIPFTTGRPGKPTAREREILTLIWDGFTTQEIAPQLGITTKTVESHRANLMRKFGVSNIAQLLRAALLEGILQVNASSRPHRPPRRSGSSQGTVGGQTQANEAQ